MATVTHVLSGAGAPADAPPSIAAHYVNTTNGDQYLAKGTGSTADWVKQGSGGGGASSEVLHITGAGDFSLGPEHAVVEAALDQIPSSEMAAVMITPGASRQFDVHFKAPSTPEGQVLFVMMEGGATLAGGVSILPPSSAWAATRPYGVQIQAEFLSGEAWGRVYYDATAGSLALVVIVDAPAS